MATQRDYKFPVWGTQAGGLVRCIGGRHIFVEKPHPSVGLDIGDDMPEDWAVIPANNLARREMQRCEFGEDDYWADFDQAMHDYTHTGPRRSA